MSEVAVETATPIDVAAQVRAALGQETVPENPAPAPEPPAVPDLAAIRVPEHEIVPEKFRGKGLSDVFEAHRNAEQYMHAKANEAAQARRENEELKTRLAAAEQFAKMAQQPPPPAPAPVDVWTARGINPEEAVITDTRRFAEATRDIAVEGARAAAREETQKVRAEWENDQTAQRQADGLVKTWDTAKEALRARGHNISDDQWKNDLAYIAPAVVRENDVFNTDRYVAHYEYLKGTPAVQKPTVPSEGNPPVSSRTAAGPQASARPSVSRERTAIVEQIGRSLGFEGDRLKNYINRAIEEGSK